MTRTGERVSTLACACAAVGAFALCVKGGSDVPSAVAAVEQGVHREPTVAVLDVSRVFKEYTVFLRGMKRLKDEMAVSQTELLTLKGEAEGIQEAMKSLEEGTPEHIKNKAAVAAIGFKLEQLKKEQELEFMEMERVLYANAYKQLKRAVDTHARRTGIELVIRFNGEEPDLSDREQLISAINRPVVFQANLDITDEVIAAMNRLGEAVQTEP